MSIRISMESDGLGREEGSGRQREEQACGTGDSGKGGSKHSMTVSMKG